MEIGRSHPLAPMSKVSTKGEKPRDRYRREGRECPGSQCLGEESKEVSRFCLIHLCPTYRASAGH